MSHFNARLLDRLAFVPLSFERSLGASLSCNSKETEISSGSTANWSTFRFLSRCLVAKNRVAVSNLILKCLSQFGATVATDEQGMELLLEFKSLRRLLSIPIDSIPSIESLEAADSIEFQLYEAEPLSSRLSRALPIDLTDLSKLKKKVEAIRSLTGSRIPIGASAIKGDVRADIPLFIQLNFDFVTWIDPSSEVKSENDPMGRIPDPWLLSQSSQLAEQASKSGSPMAIYFETSIRDGFDFVKCLALGASSIVIDRFLLSNLEQMSAATQAPMSSSGLLGDIGRMIPSQSSNREVQLIKSLHKMHQEIESVFSFCGLPMRDSISLANLVAIDEETHRLTKAPLLSH